MAYNLYRAGTRNTTVLITVCQSLLRLAALVAITVLAVGANAQSLRVDTLTVSVCFKQSRAELDTGFMDNGAALAAFVEAYNSLVCDCDSDAHPSVIHIRGYASPEGSLAINQRLSLERGHAIAQYLNQSLGIDPARMEIHPMVRTGMTCSRL